MSSDRPRIVVAGISVAIDRKDIKNLHLGVYPPDGRVRVAAPLAVNDEAIRLAVIGKLGWIKRQRAKFQSQPRQSERRMVSGETHYVFGRPYRLRVLHLAGAQQITVDPRGRLLLNCSPEKSAEQRQVLLQEWYRARLRETAQPLLQEWSARLEVSPAFWGIRKMKTRWGSCNTGTGRIWLNLELAKKPLHCIEFIIVHELLHLQERHHNQRFMALMDQHLPNWRLLRDELNHGMLGAEKWDY
ncbi:M48 family metallopeptidase [Chitinilyticum litopenaei]|uniref:M48 family metallopeptidase n=1 Tax=Chitinilyticum litopenaei TaxID=1121276 RepID=UPI0003FD1661|nr:SprT family zinc-dependent metalloprotease [Chitinilyticum litopenaei]